jgi:hypothetical protein
VIVGAHDHRDMLRAPIFLSRILLSLLLAATLTACDELAPRADPEAGHAYNAEPGPSPMRERTLEQGEPR